MRVWERVSSGGRQGEEKKENEENGNKKGYERRGGKNRTENAGNSLDRTMTTKKEGKRMRK